MKRFKSDQRVRIVKPCHQLRGLQGWTGTVARLRRCDEGAWVCMDRTLPRSLRSFDDPDDSRFRHILVFPEECKPLVPEVLK